MPQIGATAADILQAFPGKVWAYQCVENIRFFLEPTAGMGTWQEWARAQLLASPLSAAACLPAVQCRQAVQASAAGVATTPTGLGDPCYDRLKRERRNERAAAPPTSPLTPISLPFRQAGFENQLAAPGLPLPAILLATPGHAPFTGAARPYSDASAPMRVSSGVRSAQIRTINRVHGGGCTTGSSSAVAAHMAGECGAATTVTLLPGHGRTTLTAPAPAVAQQIRPVDPDRRLPLAPGFGPSPTTANLATEPPQVPDCQQFLEGLLNGMYYAQRDEAVLEDIANASFLRGDRPEIRLRHKNGRVRVYSLQLSPRQALFTVSQANKRKAAARRLTEDGCGVAARLQRGRMPPSGGPVRLSASKQVRLVAALSMSRVGFNRWRSASGAARSGLAKLPLLPARREMNSPRGKKVIVTRPGAHLSSLTAAIQERVTALCDADLFVERPVRDALAVPNEAGTAAAFVAHPGSSPSTEQDMQVTLGLDKGGDPATVKIVATIINQPHPNSPFNNMMVGVCPCGKDTDEELASMLGTLLPQVSALLRDGVLVRGVRRLVRLMPGCDYDAQCNVVEQNGATATQRCLSSQRAWWPSKQQAVLDAIYGTLQYVTGGRHLPEATHFADQMVLAGGTPADGEPGTPEHHCSVVRSPLLAINPRQIGTIPLDTTQGIDHRFLRLAIKMMMVSRSATEGAADGRQAAAAFSLELVKLLQEKV